MTAVSVLIYCSATSDFHIIGLNLQQRAFSSEAVKNMVVCLCSVAGSVLFNVSTFQRDFPGPF